MKGRLSTRKRVAVRRRAAPLGRAAVECNLWGDLQLSSYQAGRLVIAQGRERPRWLVEPRGLRVRLRLGQ